MKIRKRLGAGGVIWLRRAGIAGRCTKGASLWLGQPLTQSRVDIVVRLQLRCGKSCKTRNGRPDENEIVFRNNGYKMRERRLLLDKNRHFIPLSQLSKKRDARIFTQPHIPKSYFWPSLYFVWFSSSGHLCGLGSNMAVTITHPVYVGRVIMIYLGFEILCKRWKIFFKY